MPKYQEWLAKRSRATAAEEAKKSTTGSRSTNLVDCPSPPGIFISASSCLGQSSYQRPSNLQRSEASRGRDSHDQKDSHVSGLPHSSASCRRRSDESSSEDEAVAVNSNKRRAADSSYRPIGKKARTIGSSQSSKEWPLKANSGSDLLDSSSDESEDGSESEAAQYEVSESSQSKITIKLVRPPTKKAANNVLKMPLFAPNLGM